MRFRALAGAPEGLFLFGAGRVALAAKTLCLVNLLIGTRIAMIVCPSDQPNLVITTDLTGTWN